MPCSGWLRETPSSILSRSWTCDVFFDKIIVRTCQIPTNRSFLFACCTTHHEFASQPHEPLPSETGDTWALLAWAEVRSDLGDRVQDWCITVVSWRLHLGSRSLQSDVQGFSFVACRVP